MVGSLRFGDETLITLDDDRLAILDGPLADVGESLASNLGLLGSLRDGPSL